MEQRSEFVTVVAWIFIILSGLGLLMTAMDTALFWFIPFAQLMPHNQKLTPDQMQVMQDMTLLMSGLFRWMLMVFLLLQIWVLISSIGLLKRKNWARISFIVLMALGLFWNGMGLLFGLLFVVGIHFAFQNAALPAGMPPGFQSLMQVIMVFTLMLNIGFLVLMAWIIKKLVSEKIRREFLSPVSPSNSLAA